MPNTQWFPFLSSNIYFNDNHIVKHQLYSVTIWHHLVASGIFFTKTH